MSQRRIMRQIDPSRGNRGRHLRTPGVNDGLPYATLEDVMTKLQEIELDSDLVMKALDQARISHGDQKRDNGNPYLEEHVYPVTLDFIDYCERHDIPVNSQTVAFALLHDVPEDDENVSLDDIAKDFGPMVYLHVTRVTKPDYLGYDGENIAEKKAARDKHYVQNLIELGSHEEVALKLLDRDNNLSCVHQSSREKLVRYVKATEDLYLPLAAATDSLELYSKLHKKVQELKEIISQA